VHAEKLMCFDLVDHNFDANEKESKHDFYTSYLTTNKVLTKVTSQVQYLHSSNLLSLKRFSRTQQICLHKLFSCLKLVQLHSCGSPSLTYVAKN